MDENIGDEYKNYWETNMFYHTEELDSWGLDEAFYGGGGYYESSSPDGAHSSSAASKNILLERNRRKKLNERLFALRAIVPNITKMDKASIIKDAIAYIEKLHDQERRIKSEILELESGKFIKNDATFEFEEEAPIFSSSRKKKKKRNDQSYDFKGSRIISPIEDLEMTVCFMGEKTVVVSITCSKKRDTIVRLCEIFEALNLKIVTANITTTFCGRLFKTLFIQTNEEEKEHLKIKVETAISAAVNDPEIRMSI